MQSTRDVITRMLSEKEATEKQEAMIADFYETLEGWRDGALPLSEAVKLTGDGWLRNQIVRKTTPGSDRWNLAMRFLDAVMVSQMTTDTIAFYTDHGWFTEREIREIGGDIQFKPDPSTGEIMVQAIRLPLAYENGRPVYKNTVGEAFTRGVPVRDPARYERTKSEFADDWLA